MTNWINYILTKISLVLGAGRVLVFCVCAVLLQTLFCVVLAIFKQGYSVKKRIWCVFSVSATVLFFVAMLVSIPAQPSYTILLVAFALLCFAPILCIREKPLKSTEEQKELARFIDREFMRTKELQNHEEFPLRVEEKSTQSNSELEEENRAREDEIKNYEIDFGHVKNVIRRMDYFGLSANDKKQVRELEIALAEAERGEFTKEVKSRINDGLSALLKIMSKYGV